MSIDINDETRFLVPAHVLARPAGGELIILNLENEQYYSLQDVGARAFSLAQDGLAWGAVLDALLTEWTVERSILVADLTEMFDGLVSEGIVAVG